MLMGVRCQVEITNSKGIRKPRFVLRDPVAKEKFVQGESLERVLDAIASPEQPKKGSLAGDIDELTQALKRHSWTTLVASRGDSTLLEKVEEAEKLLRELKRALG